jgi:nitrogen-specific signal transduction histidine kinase
VTSIGETSIALQHEINNPLSALLGHAELMMLEANDTGADTDSLRVILEQARRIAEVVKRLGRLRDPRTVEYAPGARMLDLSERKTEAP